MPRPAAQLSLFFCAVMAIGSLGQPVSAKSAADGRALTIFAAASVKNALDETAKAFEARHDGARTAISYAGTNALARQIEQGAPADVFIAADRLWMKYLRERKLLQPGGLDLVSNALVLIAPAKPATGPLAVTDIASHLRSGRLALADTRAVPAGRYAKTALIRLGQWNILKDRLAEASNVRLALSHVARGEAPLGIVYASDARAEPGVRVVAAIPESLHGKIIYQAAGVAGAKHRLTQEFLLFLQSDAAKRAFEKHGFIYIGKPASGNPAAEHSAP